MKFRFFIVILSLLVFNACNSLAKKSPVPKDPYIVSWNNTQVELDITCNANPEQYCTDGFNEIRAFEMAKNYCGRFKLTAHPEYFWRCTNTNPMTQCTTTANPIYEAIPNNYGTIPKETTTCETLNKCSDYHLFFNCIPSVQ